MIFNPIYKKIGNKQGELLTLSTKNNVNKLARTEDELYIKRSNQSTYTLEHYDKNGTLLHSYNSIALSGIDKFGICEGTVSTTNISVNLYDFNQTLLGSTTIVFPASIRTGKDVTIYILDNLEIIAFARIISSPYTVYAIRQKLDGTILASVACKNFSNTYYPTYGAYNQLTESIIIAGSDNQEWTDAGDMFIYNLKNNKYSQSSMYNMQLAATIGVFYSFT